MCTAAAQRLGRAASYFEEVFVEIMGALLSVAAVLTPSLKGWVDSVSYRNRAQARAALIRARREQGNSSQANKQNGKRGDGRG